MIDDIPDRIDDIYISLFTKANSLAKLINRTEININDKHTLFDGELIPVRNRLAHGYNPSIIRFEQILYVGRSKLQNARVLLSRFEPNLIRQLRIFTHRK
ncbi:hypothetical protein D3C78_1101160 [compost metagenome]